MSRAPISADHALAPQIDVDDPGVIADMIDAAPCPLSPRLSPLVIAPSMVSTLLGPTHMTYASSSLHTTHPLHTCVYALQVAAARIPSPRLLMAPVLVSALAPHR